MQQLDRLVHWIQAHRDATRAQRAVVGDGELRGVLQEDGDAVTGPKSASLQKAGEAADRGIELGEGDGATIEMDGRTVGYAPRLPGEDRRQRLLGEANRFFVQAGGPVLLPDGVHGNSRRRRRHAQPVAGHEPGHPEQSTEEEQARFAHRNALQGAG